MLPGLNFISDHMWVELFVVGFLLVFFSRVLLLSSLCKNQPSPNFNSTRIEDLHGNQLRLMASSLNIEIYYVLLIYYFMPTANCLIVLTSFINCQLLWVRFSLPTSENWPKIFHVMVDSWFNSYLQTVNY